MAEALLTHKGSYSFFQYKGERICFSTSPYLERYVKVIEWDKGYLVVQVKLSTKQEIVEDYIDITPILEHLCIDADEFLKDITEVRIAYGD